jgi:hypothetical protein
MSLQGRTLSISHVVKLANQSESLSQVDNARYFFLLPASFFFVLLLHQHDQVSSVKSTDGLVRHRLSIKWEAVLRPHVLCGFLWRMSHDPSIGLSPDVAIRG